MALTARLLHLRPQSRSIPSPSFTRFFSSSSDEPKPNQETDATSSPSQSRSSISSYFSDVKGSLRQQTPPPPHRPYPSRKPFNPSATTNTTPPSSINTQDEIRKNLSEFRRRVVAPFPSTPDGRSPSSSSQAQPVSFRELYKRHVLPTGENNGYNVNQPAGGKHSFQAIRESIKNIGPSTAMNQGNGVGKMNDSMSFARSKWSWLRPADPNAKESPVVIGGSGHLPESVFGKEMTNSKEDARYKDTMRTEFCRMYSYVELGDKLRMLRPDKKDGKSWFSLAELNERLIKLREYEEKETRTRVGGLGVTAWDLRESLVKINLADEEKKKNNMMYKLDVLGQIGGPPTFMLSPPKEKLIETYFHPDNMSSEEKLKLELKKVRDEFKMSESDCGSARVQVAQLTTKIKHLSSVLHKKDKHSRKGLIAMVQRRKKLLKYLRRTDWDSYCLVLSKLGLRDNPDYKAYA